MTLRFPTPIRYLVAPLFTLLLAGCASPTDQATATTPGGASLAEWKGEVIALPPSFAPTMGWQGEEELRFAPGMFTPEATDFFSYAFVLRYPGRSQLSTEKLAELITLYYQGLMVAVEKDTKNADAASIAQASVTSVQVLQSGQRTVFEVNTYDAFATRKTIVLTMLATVERSAKGICARLQVSPQPQNHPIWTELQRVSSELPCL